MLELKALAEHFAERKVPAYDMSPDKAFPPRISVTAVCEADMKWRLIEESGLESFQEREDGKLVFHSCFSDRGSVFSWLLSMGDRVELGGTGRTSGGICCDGRKYLPHLPVMMTYSCRD